MTTGAYHNIFRNPRYARATALLSRGNGADPVREVVSRWILASPPKRRYSLVVGCPKISLAVKPVAFFWPRPSVWGYHGLLHDPRFKTSLLTLGSTSMRRRAYSAWQFGRYRTYPDAPAVSYTPQAVVLDRTRALLADVGAYDLTAQDVALREFSSNPNYELVARAKVRSLTARTRIHLLGAHARTYALKAPRRWRD